MSTVEQPQTEAKKRSRDGCLTCRKRKKKCDQTRLPEHNGACERCFLASYTCEWPPPPGQRPVREFVKGSRASRGSKSGPAGSTAGGSPGAIAGPSHSDTVAAPPQLSAVQPSPFQQPVPFQPYAPPATLASTSAQPAPASFYALPADPTAPAVPLPYAFPQPVAPAAATAGPPTTDFASIDLFGPYASLFNPDNELNNFFASLDTDFNSWDVPLGSSAGETPSWGPSPAHPDGQTPAPTNGAGTSSSNGAGAAKQPARNGEEGAGFDDESYDLLNEEWFSQMPKPVRDVLVRKVGNVAAGNESGRNAAMAMVMLYRLRRQEKLHQAGSADPGEAAAIADQHARLLAQGNSYFQKALDHLSGVGKEIPFEAKLLAALDLLNFQFDQFGAAASHAITLLAEYFITEELGPQPLARLTNMTDTSDYLLSTYVWHDVLRCVSSIRRRTLFSFPSLPGDSISSTPWKVPPAVSEDIQSHFGLPVGLMLCMASIANLSNEMDALPDEIVKAKAEAIERAIRAWTPPPATANELADGTTYLEKLSTAEMWRHTAIIFLHQAVHGRGPVSTVISEATQQVLAIGSRLFHTHTRPTSLLDDPSVVHPSAAALVCPAGPSASADSSSSSLTSAAAANRTVEYLPTPLWRAFPWFLAGTCCLLPQDRELCRRGLRACSAMAAYRDDLAALERVWKDEDERGWTIDWRTFLLQNKLVISFL